MAKERMANAAGYTFYFVGNIDEAAIRPLIEQYIATLPANKGVKSNWVNVDSRPQGKNTVRFERPMETPKTSIQTFWFDAKTPYSTENAIKAELLGKLLDKVILQKVREDAGAAYTTNAGGFSAFNGDSPLTLVVADCPVKPEFTEQTLQILEEAMANLCRNVDAESLNGFKNELIKDFQSEIKENDYWMKTIGRYVERGIDEYTGYEQLVKAQTPETIAAFARQLCNQGSKMEFVMTPAE
jgi:zinc protease